MPILQALRYPSGLPVGLSGDVEGFAQPAFDPVASLLTYLQNEVMPVKIAPARFRGTPTACGFEETERVQVLHSQGAEVGGGGQPSVRSPTRPVGGGDGGGKPEALPDLAVKGTPLSQRGGYDRHPPAKDRIRYCLGL